MSAYYIVLLAKGAGQFETAICTEMPVDEGNVLLLYPGLWHLYKPKAGIEGILYWIGFKGKQAEALFEKSFSKQQPLLQAGYNNDILALFKKIIDTASWAEKGWERLSAAYLFQLLTILYLHQLDIFRGKNEQAYKIEKANYLMQDAFNEQVQITLIARQVNMCYSAFGKLFKQQTGMSPGSYLLMLRIEKAKELLAGTTLTIEQIAHETGFSSIQYLSKFFTKKVKKTPSAYRRSRGK